MSGEEGEAVSVGIARDPELQEGGDTVEVEVAIGVGPGPGLGKLMMSATIATTTASTPAIAPSLV
jgi:hypothetical protein